MLKTKQKNEKKITTRTSYVATQPFRAYKEANMYMAHYFDLFLF